MIGEKTQFLNESLNSGSLSKAKDLIISYLSRKTSVKFFSSAGVEKYMNSNGSGFGVRLFGSNKMSIRFNWKTYSGDSNNLQSIDFWTGKSSKADFHVSFDSDVSLVQVLPMIVDVIKTKKLKTGTFLLPSIGNSINESEDFELKVLSESYDAGDTYDNFIKFITNSLFIKADAKAKFGGFGKKALALILIDFADKFEKKGAKLQFIGELKDLMDAKNDILGKIGVSKGTVSKGASKEDYISPEADRIERDKIKIAYEMQIEHLKNLVKMTVAGAGNALFVAGRGGIGKTFNVEQTLGELGLSDGNGYFKNTGSASAAGIYRLLFRYSDSIVFFDDSDDALKDQESRNLFKAATDTKKVRKLVWSKSGGNIVEPDDDSYDSAEEMLDAGKIPRYFEFTGKVIFISNLKPDKLDPDGALRTRAFLIDIDPTDMEVYDLMRKIIDSFKIADGLSLSTEDRLKCVDIIQKGSSKQSANFRKLERALNMMAGAMISGANLSNIEEMISLYA